MNPLFQKIVESFYGCTTGNVDSPVWFCGLEWGGGYDKDVPILLHEMKPYDFGSLQCWSIEEFKDAFWAPRSKFCQNVLKILVAIQKGSYESKDYNISWSEYEKRRLIGPNGLALILNAFPISFAGRSTANKNWTEYSFRFLDGSKNKIWVELGLKTFGDYENYVLEHRAPVYIAERKKRCPKLIIGFGYEGKFQKLWGANEEWEQADFQIAIDNKRKCYGYILDNGPRTPKTVLFITPFPSGIYGLTKDEQFNKVFSELHERLCRADLFGPNWLGEFSLQNNIIDSSSNANIFPEETLAQYDACRKVLKNISKLRDEANKQLILFDNLVPETETPSMNQLRNQIISQMNALSDLESAALKQKKETIKILKTIKASVGETVNWFV